MKLDPIQNHSDNTWATNQESKKSRNYKKRPYWVVHTYFEEHWCTNTKHSTWKVTLLVAKTVITE